MESRDWELAPLGCVRSFRRRGAECNDGDATAVGDQVSTASPGANWPSHVSATEPPCRGRGEDRAEGHPPGWSRTFFAEKRETTATDRNPEVVNGDGGREGMDVRDGNRWWAVETATASNGKLGSARRNGAADVAWPTRIIIANKPAGMGMEQKKNGCPRALSVVDEGPGLPPSPPRARWETLFPALPSTSPLRPTNE